MSAFSENIDFQPGELVESADMLSEAQAARTREEEIAVGILGTENAVPGINPLAVTANGSFTLTVGGVGQGAWVQGSWCDDCPATNLQCPGSGPTQRIDSIAIKAVPATADGDTITREVEATDGSKSNVAESMLANQIALQYVEGSETPPTGYVEFARVTVPANATGLQQADIQILFPDPRAAITGSDSTPVQSINGVGGTLTLKGEGAATVTENGQEIDITVPPTVINGQNGPAFMIQGDGEITVTEPESGVIQINAPPAQSQTSLNGKTGAVVLKGSGVAAVTSIDDETLQINVPAPPPGATINGDGPEAFTLENGNGVNVRRVSSGKFAFDNEGVTSFNGEAGDVTLSFDANDFTESGNAVSLKNPSPRNVPYRVTFLQGGGYANPGCPGGADWGISLSPDGGIKVGYDTVDGSPFSIGFRTVFHVTNAFQMTLRAIGLPTCALYVNGQFVANAAGNMNTVTANIPAGTVTIDLVYNAGQMGRAYYLGSEGGQDNFGGSLTAFGWVPLDANNNVSSNITSMSPG